MTHQFTHVTVLSSFVTDFKEFLLTGDISGNVKITNKTTDEEVTFKAGGSIFSMGAVGLTIYVGTEFGDIEAYSLYTGKFIAYFNSFVDPVTYLSCSKKYIFSITGESYINIWSSVQPHKSILGLNCERSRIYSLEISTDESFVAASKSCGTVSVWEICSDNFYKIQELKHPVNNSNLPHKFYFKTRISWSCRNQLAVPGQNAVYIFKSKCILPDTKKITPTKQFELENIVNYETKAEETYISTSFSINGEYLSCGSLSGTLLVWSSRKKQIVFQKISAFKNIKQITFTNRDKDLQVLDCGGVFEIKEFLKQERCKRTLYKNVVSESNFMNAADSIPLPYLKKRFPEQIEKYNERDVKKQWEIALQNTGNFKLDAATDKLKLLTKTTRTHSGLIPTKASNVNENHMSVNKDQSKLFVETTNTCKKFSMDLQERHLGNFHNKSRHSRSVSGSLKCKAESKIGNFFILVWNRFGFIQRHESSLFVFVNQGLTILSIFQYDNRENFSQASLCEKFAVFANSNHGSAKGIARRYSFSTSGTDWCISFPKNEYCVGLAIGNNWIVVCTNGNKIRVFDHDGGQKQCFEVAQLVDFVVGHNEYIFFTTTIQWTSNFAEHFYSVYKISNCHSIEEIKNCCRLPVSKNGFIKWIGFTDEGNPAFLDSENIVRVFKSVWTQKCYSKSKWFRWNVDIKVQSVNETSQTIRFYTCTTDLIQQQEDIEKNIRCKSFQVPDCKVLPVLSTPANQIMAFQENSGKITKYCANEVKVKSRNNTTTKYDVVKNNNYQYDLKCEHLRSNEIKKQERLVVGSYSKHHQNQIVCNRRLIRIDGLMLSSNAPISCSFIKQNKDGHTLNQKPTCRNFSLANPNRKIKFKAQEQKLARKEQRRKLFVRSVILQATRNRYSAIQVSKKLKETAICRLRKQQCE